MKATALINEYHDFAEQVVLHENREELEQKVRKMFWQEEDIKIYDHKVTYLDSEVRDETITWFLHELEVI